MAFRKNALLCFFVSGLIAGFIAGPLRNDRPAQSSNDIIKHTGWSSSTRNTAHTVSPPARSVQGTVASLPPNKRSVISKIKNLHVPFIANNGQTDENVKFYAKTFGGTVFVTGEGEIGYRMQKSEPRSQKSEERQITLTEQLIGAKVAEVKGEGAAVTKVSYFRGSDPSKWVSGIPTYDLVNLGEVYDGIEMKLKAYGNNVEKLFYVKPGAESSDIQMKIDGATNLKVNADGELVAETDQGEVRFTKPVAFQDIDGKRTEVAVKYAVANPESPIPNPQLAYSFIVGDYDKSKELVIDPLLASTFFGGNGFDEIASIAVGPDGNVYIAGRTLRVPTIVTEIASIDESSCNSAANGICEDIFVAKISSDLTSLYAVAYMGGTAYYADIFSYSLDVAMDADGNIYVAGGTRSKDFPVTTGSYDTSFNSSSANPYSNYKDAFLAKLNGDLILVASTFLGGNYNDSAESIAVDATNNVYVAGNTSSADFPTTKGAYGLSYNGNGNQGSNVFISKLNADLTTLLASTYLGGSSSDSVGAIALDSSGNVYVTGGTFSADFPMSVGAPVAFLKGSDAFLSKLSGDLTQLLVSRYLGGNYDDVANALTLGPDGNVYVAGTTGSSDFPVTTGTCKTSKPGYYPGYHKDAFVSIFDGGLTTLNASACIGGSDSEGASSIALDSAGNIYVAGQTLSTDYPVTAWAYDTSANGKSIYYSTRDVFISKLGGDLKVLLSSTLLGGGSNDYASSIAIDKTGNVYIAGSAVSYDFPVTPDAYDPVHGNHLVCISSAMPSTQDDIKITVVLDGACGTFSTAHTKAGNDIRVDITRTIPPGVACPAMIMLEKVTEDIGQLAVGKYTVTVYLNKQIFASRTFEVKDIPPMQPLDCPLNGIYDEVTDGFISKFDPWLSSEAGSTGISVSPAVLSFETVGVGKASTKDISVINISDKAQTVSSISITGTDSGDFSQTNTCGDLTANGSCKISVTFSPEPKGEKIATLNISFVGIDTPTEVSLTGTGQQQHTLTIIRTGTGGGSVMGTGFDCGDDNPCIQTYPEGTWVKVIPFAEKGSKFEKLEGACSGTKHCSVKMDADKTVTVTFTKPGPEITTPAVLNFGKVSINKPRTKKLKIMNRGKFALNVSGLSVDGSEFSTNWSSQKPIKSKCGSEVTVTFTPTSTGPKTATLTITSDDPGHPEKTVILKGTGK